MEFTNLITHWAVFTDVDDAARERKYKSVNEALTAQSPLKDSHGIPYNWSEPKGHADNHCLAMPLADWCLPLMPVDSSIQIVDDASFRADAGWFPPLLEATPSEPWWGFFVFWR